MWSVHKTIGRDGIRSVYVIEIFVLSLLHTINRANLALVEYIVHPSCIQFLATPRTRKGVTLIWRMSVRELQGGNTKLTKVTFIPLQSSQVPC